MKWLPWQNKALPMRPASSLLIGKNIIVDSMKLITEMAHAGKGGLVAVMKHKKHGLYAVQLETLAASVPSRKYSVDYLNERIETTLTVIDHAFKHPEIYEIEKALEGRSGDLALVAMVTPVDQKGLVTTDDKALGWEVTAGTSSGIDFDFLLMQGSVIGGTISFDAGKLFPSEKIPYLAHGPSVHRNMWKVFRKLSGHHMSSVSTS